MNDDLDFAETLRRAIAARGLSLNRISRHLQARGTPVTVATLSYWQSGQRRPERGSSLRALGQLEQVLQLPGGTLSAKLGPPRERARLSDEEAQRKSFITLSEALNEALDTIQVPLNDRMARLSLASRMIMRPGRLKDYEEVRQIMRAERDGPDRWLVAVQDENPTGDVLPRVRPVHNCRIGRVQTITEDRATITELILASPLRRGEAMMADFTIRYAAQSGEDTVHARRHRTGLRILTLQVCFADGEVPRRVWAYHEPFDGERTTHELEVVNHLAEWVFVDVPAGVAAIEWEWD